MTSQTTARTGLTLAQEYAYKNLSGNRTTSQISGYTAKVNSSAVDSYTYSYDNLGNITVINRSGNLPISYTYDAQNQLIRVVEGVYRYEYTYDTYGNILTVKYYDDDIEELISSNTYSYTDSQWVDQLTAFNGQSITYDEIGNPLSYYNGSRYTFTWNGRELATAVKGSTSISYKYGADGLRTQKTVGSTVYNYYYADGLLIRQTWGTNYMDFLYDESGSAYSFIYNGTQYYYVKNLQGDVMRIVNTSGTVVANYTYDAWGKVTSSGNVVGQYNPIRYRGYYYDTDTGFYYLQSRYYDPTIKRFISADGVVSGVGGELLGYNQYAYCFNDPCNKYDSNGMFPISITSMRMIIKGIVIAAVLTFVGTTIAACIKNAVSSSKEANFDAVEDLLQKRMIEKNPNNEYGDNVHLPVDQDGLLYNKQNRDYASEIIKNDLGPVTNRTVTDISSEIFAHQFMADIVKPLSFFTGKVPKKYDVYKRLAEADIDEIETRFSVFDLIGGIFEWE